MISYTNTIATTYNIDYITNTITKILYHLLDNTKDILLLYKTSNIITIHIITLYITTLLVMFYIYSYTIKGVYYSKR